MILKFSKSLNEKKEFTLITFDMNYELIKKISEDKFNNNIYEDDIYYYYYIKDIIDIGNYEKFKVKVKKGDIVSLTARDNSYMIFPSKRSFSYTFNLDYNKVLKYTYKEVLYEAKPYEVKYVKDNDLKINDGVVYTLAQLCSYISAIIKSYIYKKTKRIIDYPNNDDPIKRVINKYYSEIKNELNRKYELNVKKVFLDKNNKWNKTQMFNISNSNKYLYDYYLIRMFAYMILAKSKKDIEIGNDPLYSFTDKFDTLEDVYRFLENNQDLVNNFFIETETLFNKPNSMIISYSPHINGVYMFYEYNGVKTYLYRNIDKEFFDEKSLKCTYVTTKFRHRIFGIKKNFSFLNTLFMNNED